MKVFITAMILAAICGCVASTSNKPSKDWQGDLQKALDQQKQKQN
jgi:hypothetical protein